MQRGSDKHGPRVDDQIEHDVAALTHGGDEGRIEAFRQEAPGDGEAGMGHRADLDDAPGTGLPETALAEREELAAALAPGTFPATAARLREAATASYASAQVIGRLADLPEDCTYETVGDVWRALGEPVERHTGVAAADSPAHGDAGDDQGGDERAGDERAGDEPAGDEPAGDERDVSRPPGTTGDATSVEPTLAELGGRRGPIGYIVLGAGVVTVVLFRRRRRHPSRRLP